MVYGVLLGIETVQPQNVPKKPLKFKSRESSLCLIGGDGVFLRTKPTLCFFHPGPDNRGELGGGDTHRSTEDREREREEVERARALAGPCDGRPQRPL